MAVFSTRFTLLATAMATTLVLNACQQKPDEVEPTPVEEEVIAPVTVPEVDTPVEEVEVEEVKIEVSDTLKDYTRAMTRMNDEMNIGMAYNDPDTAFAKSMLGHHRGALDMAVIQKKYGMDAQMLALAQEITDAQQLEIDTMRKWLASHPDVPNPKPETPAMQQAYIDDVEDLKEEMITSLDDPKPDLAYARGMLIHHKAAVDMALTQLKYGTDEEMRKLALQIINRQQSEIQRIENWIAANSSLSDVDGSTDDATKGNTDNELMDKEDKTDKPTA